VIRVVVIERHEVLAKAIGTFLATEDEFELLEILPAANNGVERVSSTRPHVLLMDIDLPGADGVSGTSRVAVASPETKVLVIIGLSDTELPLRGIAAGASDVVQKNRAAGDLVEVIHRIINGQETFARLHPRLSTSGREEGSAGETTTRFRLSRRELEVLQGLVDGLSTEELASAMFVSPRTVQGHVQSIVTKMQVRSKLEAVLTGLREGIVRLAVG
jgi:two-component system, NarL family, response regulator LiaR